MSNIILFNDIRNAVRHAFYADKGCIKKNTPTASSLSSQDPMNR